MVSEERVRQFVIVWLNSENYKIMNLVPGPGRPAWPEGKRGAPPIAPHPPDIYAKRSDQGYYYYIEAKGDPASTTQFYAAIGQIATSMGAATPARYGVALPMSFCSIIKRHYTYEAWKDLGAYILLVEDGGRVHELNPSVRNFEWICDYAEQ